MMSQHHRYLTGTWRQPLPWLFVQLWWRRAAGSGRCRAPGGAEGTQARLVDAQRQPRQVAAHVVRVDAQQVAQAWDPDQGTVTSASR